MVAGGTIGALLPSEDRTKMGGALGLLGLLVGSPALTRPLLRAGRGVSKAGTAIGKVTRSTERSGSRGLAALTGSNEAKKENK